MSKLIQDQLRGLYILTSSMEINIIWVKNEYKSYLHDVSRRVFLMLRVCLQDSDYYLYTFSYKYYGKNGYYCKTMVNLWLSWLGIHCKMISCFKLKN